MAKPRAIAQRRDAKARLADSPGHAQNSGTMGWLVTLFLAGGGAFSAFCAWQNYDWFFNSRAARPFVLILGRKWARTLYILLGFFLIVPGALRIVYSPVKFTAEHARHFASPFGFALLEPDATQRIQGFPGVFNYRASGDRWLEFSMVMKPQKFPMLENPTSLFVDIEGGFMINERKFSGKECSGVVMYFDAAYRLCDHVLFSKTPLDSAEFIVLVWDTPTSRKFGCDTGLIASFHRSGEPMYEAFIRP